MGLFDKGVDPAEYEKLRAWTVERIASLEKQVTATANESAIDAQRALIAAEASRAKVESLAEEMQAAIEDVRKAKGQVQDNLAEVSSSRNDYLQDAESLRRKASESIALFEKMEVAEQSTQKLVNTVQERIEEVERFLAQAQEIPPSLENLNKQVLDANASSENIRSLLSHSVKRKMELDEVHKEVLGHDVEDDQGNVERVDGLRDELNKAFEGLNSRVVVLDEEVDQKVAKVEADQLRLREAQTEEFASLLKGGRVELDDVVGQLKALLPGGLAAGLSAAYEAKKEEECSSLSSHERNFRFAVVGLVLISLIPFGVDVYLLVGGATLADVLRDAPKLIFAILPLYFPVLWLAYSANKRLNLSKRLIEEYTHKAVLGKTFSGLSNQIETLPHESLVKEELRTRLLFNVLQVSAENPGKLITDYGKADHPLMDVLEKSARLSESVDALSKIPGMAALAKKLAARRDVILKEQDTKIEEGLAANDEVEKKPV
ncbi:hypothetical protein OVA13_11370 [Pseudoxanthomonas sp. SL93]|uniref:hypothetical protein n=1 Tax=Pseudoxanthomonas sp. SL93 TaxID=2995142 RepID=UPI00226F8913|nr:hypothetical protein [Pseudoxanthomonas sp. SL93]WAC62003.1 hypothetical protein OVA13_11370 [Pseudoxanthomonas sp. SL93]